MAVDWCQNSMAILCDLFLGKMLILVNFWGRKILEEILWEKFLGREKLNQKLLGETFFILVTPLSPDVSTILYRTSGPGMRWYYQNK